MTAPSWHDSMPSVGAVHLIKIAISGRFAMAAVGGLRSDFDGAALRRLARASRDAKQVRRLLALATIYEGGTRSEAARIGVVALQIVRDWVVRFNCRVAT